MIKIKKPSKKLLIIGVLALLLTAGAVGYLLNERRNNVATADANQAQGKLNLDPPTEEDKKAADDNKQRLVNREDSLKTQPSSTSGKKSVKPVMTFVEQNGQQVEMGGYVPGVFEDDGKCIAKFSRGNNTLTKQVIAVKEGNSVHCPLLIASTNEFSTKGTWTATLAYESSTAAGESDSRNVEVK